MVEPRPEWVGNPNNVPTGRIREIAPFGKDGALYVGDDRRAFAAYVFVLGTTEGVDRRGP